MTSPIATWMNSKRRECKDTSRPAPASPTAAGGAPRGENAAYSVTLAFLQFMSGCRAPGKFGLYVTTREVMKNLEDAGALPEPERGTLPGTNGEDGLQANLDALDDFKMDHARNVLDVLVKRGFAVKRTFGGMYGWRAIKSRPVRNYAARIMRGARHV